jgi:hypothetical protein
MIFTALSRVPTVIESEACVREYDLYFPAPIVIESLYSPSIGPNCHLTMCVVYFYFSLNG